MARPPSSPRSFRREIADHLPARLQRHLRYRDLIGHISNIAIRTGPGPGPALVLAPHSDDEIIGAGGVAALHAQAGHPVIAAVATDGHLGTPEGMGPEELVPLREAESLEAARHIGFDGVEFGRLTDRSAASLDHGAAWLSLLMEQLRPHVVYLPSPVDFHPDHTFVNLILIQALGRSRWRPTEIAGYEVWTPLIPNLVVDITPVAHLKARALASFHTQTSRSNIAGASDGLGRRRAGVHLPSASTHGEAFHTSTPAEFISLCQKLDPEIS